MFAPIVKAVGKFALPYAVKLAGKFAPYAAKLVGKFAPKTMNFLGELKNKFAATKSIVNEGIDVARKAVDLVPNSSIKDKLNSALTKGNEFVNNAESKAQNLINTGQRALNIAGETARRLYS